MSRPRNPLGWILLGGAMFSSLSQDASFYALADYRLRHGTLPFGWVAVLAQPGWAAGIVLAGLAVLLFPDGRLPSPRWRWVLWLYLAAATVYLVGVLIASPEPSLVMTSGWMPAGTCWCLATPRVLRRGGA